MHATSIYINIVPSYLQGSSHHGCSSFLLLVLDELNVVLGNDLVVVDQPLFDVYTQIPLDSDELSKIARSLGHTRPRSEFLPKFLCNLLQLEIVLLEPIDLGDVFPLVPLDALDGDFGMCFAVGVLLVGRDGLCGFLLSVLFGTGARFDGEC